MQKKQKAGDLKVIITQISEISNSENKDFSEMINEIYDCLMKLGQEKVKQYLEEKDREIMEKRDKKRYRCKGERSTSVKTKLGTIEYTRRIYFDNELKTHKYLLDEEIAMKKIGLVDKGMCDEISKMVCVMPYRKVAEMISNMTGLSISHTRVWEITQQMGRSQIAETKRLTELSSQSRLAGSIETKLLYEEADGDWLKLQGKDRKKYGASKEMKIGIAYDGVIYRRVNGKKKRRELDNKVVYASFEPVADFRKHKEAIISSRYNVDEIELRVRNGDGAQWIQKTDDCNCICVLDEYHRNKKITECVSDKKIAETLRGLLLSGQYQQLLDSIEAYINSIDDETQKSKLRELHSYYSENFSALPDYYSGGIKIPKTRKPGIIHHAQLGSMESNVFTIIGNRMKGGRACWSVAGGNNLAALLCKYYTSQSETDPICVIPDMKSKPILSASKIKPVSGKGYEIKRSPAFPSSMKWLNDITAMKPISEL